MRVAVVTDSTSDIEPEYARRLGITIVPLFVTFGTKSYRDNVDLSRAEFYRKLASERELPSTSQPTVDMFEQAFARTNADGIVCITLSSRFSGTINVARIAARSAAPQRVEVFDSQSASGGLGLMALRAAELSAAGASIDDILAALEEERRTQRLFACLPDLSHVQRTGRIGRAQAALGTIMRIVPMLAIEHGELVAKAQVRTVARAREAMLDAVLEGLQDAVSARFLVLHTNAPELAVENKKHLVERLGAQPRMLEIWEAGPVIATHGGPGAVGIAVG